MNKLALLALLAGCSDAGLSAKVDDLQQRVQRLEDAQKGPGPAARPPVAPGGVGDPEQEKAAADLLRQASQAADAMKWDEAKATLVQLHDKYPDSRPAKAATRLEQELSVIGKPAQALEVDKAVQGTVPDLASVPAAVVFFWDVANPQAKQQLSRVQQISGKYGAKGLQAAVLARPSPTAADQIPGMAKELGISVPIAIEKGATSSTYYSATGTPAAIVVKGGKVVWRGYPARLSDQVLDQLIGG